MIEISQEAFTRMVIIKIDDNLSNQVLALTPAEAAALRDQLNAADIEGTDNDAMNREAKTLRGLTIYNGHSLPHLDRRKFEAEHNVGPRFDLEMKTVLLAEE